MYRQRFFLLVLPELIAGFNATKTENEEKNVSSKKKANHLTALSHLLLHIPKQVRIWVEDDVAAAALLCSNDDQFLYVTHNLMNIFYWF